MIRMTEKRYDVIYEKEPRGQVVTDNGIPCTARTCVTRLNRLTEENEQLKEELKEFKDFVYSDEKILCYTCVNCLSKGIYQIECSEKGKVDVHGSCFAYWRKELEE